MDSENQAAKHFLGMTDSFIMRVIVYTFMASMVFLLYLYLQPVLTYGTCPLCDGNEYEKILLYFKQGGEFKVSFPFNSRILVPWLVSLIPVRDTITAFLIFNFLFVVFSVIVIFYSWRKLQLPMYLVWIGLFWLQFHWIGIIRLNIFDPVNVDLPLYLIAALLVLIVYYQKFHFLILLGPIAVMQKESIIPLMVTVLIVQLLHLKEIDKKKLFYVGLAILLSVIVKVMIENYFPSVETGKNSIRSLFINAYSILADPFRVIRWFVAMFMAFGSLFILSIIRLKLVVKKDYFMNTLAMLSLVSIALGLLGGGDMTRIMFLGFPFIMTWMLLQLKEEKSSLVVFCFLISLPLLMLQGSIPDPGVDLYKFSQWYPEFAEKSKVMIWGGFMIASVLAVVMVKQYSYKDNK